MSEDLHDIDDLFRDGLEGHLEDVPPSVWDAVNNDLDKKQASYYKSKYYRLKRIALIFMLLCFVGGSYIVYDKLNNKPTTAQKKNNTTTTTSTEENKKDNAAVVNKSNNEQHGIEQNEKTVTADDTISYTTTPLSTQKPPEVLKNNAITNQSTVHSNLPVTNDEERQNEFYRKKEAVQQKERNFNDRLTSNQNPLSTSSSFHVSPLTGKDYSAPTIDLQNLSVKQKNILSSTNKVSTIKSKAVTAHGFSLSAFAAPNFSFDRLEDDDHLAGPGRNRQEAHREERDNISFSGGLLLNYELTKNISLQSGVSVTSSSTSIAPKTVYAKADNNGHTKYELHCSSGYAYISPKGGVQPAVGDSAITSGTTSKLAYVSIPASVSYRINKGRLSFYSSIGAGFNILTKGKTNTNLINNAGSESTTASISGLKSNYVDGRIGLGIEYNLNRNLSIGVRPNARIAITPINSETPVKSYQNFLSVETGVRIRW